MAPKTVDAGEREVAAREAPTGSGWRTRPASITQTGSVATLPSHSRSNPEVRTMSTAPTDRTDATHVMTSHLLSIAVRDRMLVELCSHCATPWPCAQRVAAEIVLYGRELPR